MMEVNQIQYTIVLEFKNMIYDHSKNSNLLMNTKHEKINIYV
jgi:hypothetical protein